MKEKRKYTFIRWIKHWYQFNKLAFKLGKWKFHHLFHDIDKPFINLFKDNRYTHIIHNMISKHHIGYITPEDINYTDMMIDWECARLTKPDKPLTAELTFLNYIYQAHTVDIEIQLKIVEELKKLDLMDRSNANTIICELKELLENREIN